MKIIKIEFSRQGNFILTLLLIYFAFYGYLCNIYLKSIGESVMFLYQVMFIPGGPNLSQFFYILFPDTNPSIINLFLLIEGMVYIVIYLAILFLPFIGKFTMKWSTKNSLLALIITQILFIFYLFGPKPLLVYFTIVFIMVFREQFFEYGIRNSIWIIPFTIGMSWMWYFLMNIGFNLFVVIGMYFLRIEAYLTIFTLLVINLVTAIFASVAKQKYLHFAEQRKEIGELITENEEI